MSINKICLSGNLGSDSELRTTSSGTNVLGFNVAVNERRKGSNGDWEDYTNWVSCTMFGPRAEKLSQYLVTGTKVCIEGRIHYSAWEKDGQKRSKLEVWVDEIEFMSAKGDAMRADGAAPSEVYSDANIPF